MASLAEGAPAPMVRGDGARPAKPRWQEAGLFLGAVRPSAAPMRATPKAASKSDKAIPNVAADRDDNRPRPSIEGDRTLTRLDSSHSCATRRPSFHSKKKTENTFT